MASLFSRLKDLIGIDQPQVKQPARTPAPQQSQLRVASTPAAGQLRVQQPRPQLQPMSIQRPVIQQPVQVKAPAPQTIQVQNRAIPRDPNLQPRQAARPKLNAGSAAAGVAEGVSNLFKDATDTVPMAVGQLKAVTPARFDPVADRLRQGAQAVSNNASGNTLVKKLNQNYGYSDVNGNLNSRGAQNIATGIRVGGNVAQAGAGGVELVRNAPQIARATAQVARELPGAARTVARTAQDLNEAAFTPRLMKNDVQTLVDHSNYLASAGNVGSPSAVSKNIAKAREIAQRNGIDISQGTRAQQLENVNRLLDNMSSQNRAALQGGYVKVGRKEYPHFTSKTGESAVDNARNTKIVNMAPDEYLQKAFEATDGRLGGEYNSWLASNAQDASAVKRYADAMKRGDEFPLPYIDNALGMQDGRNRALAARLNGDSTIPVAIRPDFSDAEKISMAEEDLRKYGEKSYLGNRAKQIIDRLKVNNEGGYVRLGREEGQTPLRKGGEAKSLPKSLDSSASSLPPKLPSGRSINKPQFPEQLKNPLKTPRERGFTQTVANNEATSPAVKAGLQGNTYQTRNTNNLQIKAANLARDNEDAALKLVRNGSDDKAVATASELIKKYQDAGDFEKAIDVAETIAPKLTEAGRTAQAASIYGRLTPSGALRFTQRQIDRFNEDAGKFGTAKAAKLSPERAKQITELSKEIQTMPEGDAKTEAIGKLTDLMSSAAPTPTLTKLANIWRAGLLTSARTLEGGVLGNASKAALDLPSQAIATGIDKFLTAPLLNKGVRSNAMTLEGRLGGLAEGTKRGGRYLKTGVDPRDVGRGYDTKQANYEDGNRIINTLGKGSDYVYRAMGAVDNPFYYSGLRSAEKEQAKLQRLNGGRALSKEKSDAQAVERAREGVFQNDTALGTIAAKIKNAPQSIKDPQSRAAAQAVVDFMVPFVKIPSAVATALVDYSPAGVVAQVAKQGFKRELDVRKLNDAIGKSVTGSIGGVYTGAQLYNKGLLTLEAPQDANEKQLWDLEGKQPFSIKIAGKWRKLNYVQPLGSLMAVGGGYERAKANGDSNPVISSIASGAKAVSDQSFLKGVSGALSAVQDPARSAQTYANSSVGSLVPNFVKDLARATDPVERETNSVTDALKAGIPGVRQTNLPQRDPFGNPIQRKQSPAGVMLDPFKSTTDKSGKDPVTSEIRRIYDIDRDDPNYKVAPSKLKKQQTFAGQKVVLSPQQLDKFEATVGPIAYSDIKSVMNTNEYKTASDPDKAKTIDSIITASRTGSKADFAATNPLKDKHGTQVQVDPTKFDQVNKPSVSGSASTKQAYYKSNDAEYNDLKKTYEKKIKDGSYTTAQRIDAQNKLQKAQIGKDYPKEVRDLYGLSKADLYDYVSSAENGKDKKKLAEQVIAYGDALASATGTKNKLRNSKGALAFGPENSKKSGTKKMGSSRASRSVPKSSISYSGNAKVANAVSSSRISANSAKSKLKKPTARVRKISVTGTKSTKG